MENRQGQELRAQVNTSVFYRIVNIVFAALFFGVVLLSIFNNQSSVVTLTWPLLLLSAGVGAALVFAASRLFSLISTPKKVAEIAAVSGGMVLFAALCFLVGLSLSGEPAPGSAFEMVYSRAAAYVQNSALPDNYFLYYPTQKGFYALLCGLFSLLKIFGVTNFMTPFVVLNSLAVCVSVLLMYFCARRLFGVKKALFILAEAFFTVPLLLSGPVAYTYTTTLPVPMAVMLLWMKTRGHWRAGNNKKAILTFVLLSAVAAVGALIKLTVLVIYIAVLLDLIVLLSGRGKLKLLGAGAGLCVAVYLLGNLLVNMSAALPEYDKEDDGIPLSSWVMMGLSENGADNQADFDMILSRGGKAERDAFVSQEIGNRFGDYMPFGIFGHFGNKLAYTFGDPTLGLAQQLGEGSGGLREFFLPSGGGFGILSFLAFGLQMGVLVWAAVAAAKALYRKNDALTFARLAMLGLVAFLLFWKTEPGEIVTFVPVLLLCGLEASPAPMLALQKKRAREALQTNVAPRDTSMLVEGDALGMELDTGYDTGWQQRPSPVPGDEPTVEFHSTQNSMFQTQQQIVAQPMPQQGETFPAGGDDVTELLPQLAGIFPVREEAAAEPFYQRDSLPVEQQDEIFPAVDDDATETLPELGGLFPIEDAAGEESQAGQGAQAQDQNWADQATQKAFAQGYDVEYTTEDGQVFYQQPDGRTYYIAEDGQAYYYPQEGEEGYYAEDGQYYYAEEEEPYVQQVLVDSPDGQQQVYTQDYCEPPEEPYWDEETQQWYVPQPAAEEPQAEEGYDYGSQWQQPFDEPDTAQLEPATQQPAAEGELTEAWPATRPEEQPTLLEEVEIGAEIQEPAAETAQQLGQPDAEELAAVQAGLEESLFQEAEEEALATALAEPVAAEAETEPELIPELTLWPDIPELAEIADMEEQSVTEQAPEMPLWPEEQAMVAEEASAGRLTHVPTDVAEQAPIQPEALDLFKEVTPQEELPVAHAAEEALPLFQEAPAVSYLEPLAPLPVEEPAAAEQPQPEETPELMPELTLWPEIPELQDVAPPQEEFVRPDEYLDAHAAVPPEQPEARSLVVEAHPEVVPAQAPAAETEAEELDALELWPEEETEQEEVPAALFTAPEPLAESIMAEPEAAVGEEDPAAAVYEEAEPEELLLSEEFADEMLSAANEELMAAIAPGEDEPDLEPELTLWPEAEPVAQPAVEEPQPPEAWQQPDMPLAEEPVAEEPPVQPAAEADIWAGDASELGFNLFEEAESEATAVEEELAARAEVPPVFIEMTEPEAAEETEPEAAAAEETETVEAEDEDYNFALLPVTEYLADEFEDEQMPAPVETAEDAPVYEELFAEAKTATADQPNAVEEPEADDAYVFAAPVLDIPEEEEPETEYWTAPISSAPVLAEEVPVTELFPQVEQELTAEYWTAPISPEPDLTEEVFEPERFQEPVEERKPEEEPAVEEPFQPFPEEETVEDTGRLEEDQPELEEAAQAEVPVETPAAEERKLPLWLEMELEEALLQQSETGPVDVDKLLRGDEPEAETETEEEPEMQEDQPEEDPVPEAEPAADMPEEEEDSVPDVLQLLDAELERVVTPEPDPADICEDEGPEVFGEATVASADPADEPEAKRDEEPEVPARISDEDVDDIIAMLHIKRRMQEKRMQEQMPKPEPIFESEPAEEPASFAESEESASVEVFAPADAAQAPFPEAPEMAEDEPAALFPEAEEPLKAAPEFIAYDRPYDVPRSVFETEVAFEEEPSPAIVFEAEAEPLAAEPAADLEPVTETERAPELEWEPQPEPEPEPEPEPVPEPVPNISDAEKEELVMRALEFATGGLPVIPPAAKVQSASAAHLPELVAPPAAQTASWEQPFTPQPFYQPAPAMEPAAHYAPEHAPEPVFAPHVEAQSPVPVAMPVEQMPMGTPPAPAVQVPPARSYQLEPVAAAPQPMAPPVDEVEAILQSLRQSAPPAHIATVSAVKPQVVVNQASQAAAQPQPPHRPTLLQRPSVRRRPVSSQPENTVESVLKSLEATTSWPAVKQADAEPLQQAPELAPPPPVQQSAAPPQPERQSPAPAPAKEDGSADWNTLYSAINSGLPDEKRHVEKKPTAYDELMKMVNRAKPEDDKPN